MDRHTGKIVLNDAPSQADRRLAALEPGYAPVDGRSRTELLDFAVRFAALIRYYDERDEPDGDWVDFFLADPSMLLAAIVSIDLPALRRRFEALQEETERTRPFDRKFDLLRDTFRCVLGEARLVNRWLIALQSYPPRQDDAGLMARIVDAINSDLAAALQTLKAYDEGAGLPEALGRVIGLDYDGFLPVWQLGRCVCPDGAIYKGAARQRKIDHALPYLDPLFYAFYDFIESLQLYARVTLGTWSADGEEKPHLALYMAFVELFQHEQNTINTMATRYAELYDRRILREPLAGPVADAVYLTFALATDEAVTSTVVPRGTLFVAGQDAIGNDILYAADRDLTVTSATLSTLRTLHVVREPLFEDAPPQLVLTADIPLDSETLWPTFGSAATGSAAAFGFAIATPVLLLNGGERGIEIRIDYQDAQLDARLAKLTALTGIPEATILQTVLGSAFRLFASTAGAWFAIDSYQAFANGYASFLLQVQLPPSAPPVIAFNTGAFNAGDEGAESELTNPAPDLPAIEFWLRQEIVEISGPWGTTEVFPLSLLSAMEVVGCDVRVEVGGLADLTLTNTDGAVDPSQPFPLFGALPVAGSYLQLASVELFSKTPESLVVDLTWFNLPPNSDGFKGWYRDYVIGPDGTPQANLFNNAVFLGTFDVANPGTWTLGSERSSPPGDGVYLFRTQNDCAAPRPQPAAALCSESLFDDLPMSPHDAPAYYDPAASAIVLELTAPSYAFGNVLYAQNVLSAVIADLPDAGLCQEKCLAACAPLDEAARCIDDCLIACADQSPEVCLAPCLEKCADNLVRAAVDRLLRCLDDCAAGDPLTIDELRLSAAAIMTLPPQQRVASLDALALQTRELVSPPSACVESCLRLFRGFLDAAACLYGCLYASPAVDLVQCATKCRDELQAAYKAALELCMSVCLAPKKELRYPNDPYLPTVQAVRVDYTAHSSDVRRFHLLPFGGYEVAGTPSPLLPAFPDEGVLYLGFSTLVPPQTLSLLFRMAAADDPAAERPPVTWQYLTDDAWKSLDPAQLLSDTTNGLQNSGVVTMTLPSYDPNGSTFFNDDLQWLRATVARDASQFPRTAAIAPHVMTVTWQSGGVETLGTPLPPGTITASVQELPFIASIAQPMQSFGGRAPEDAAMYSVRIAERLRHKDRAVLAWDYERLVLERFPTIWRAAALPARNVRGCEEAGSVVVAIVPGPETQEAVNPLVPRAPGDFLARVETYLAALDSPFVSLRVVDPVYVRLKVTAVVQFAGAAESGGSIDRLNDDLVQYLSPWTPDAARGSRGPRYYTEDEISDFIQSRPYVATLIDAGYHYTPDPQPLDWYYLTSAEQHQIVEDEAPEPCR